MKLKKGYVLHTTGSEHMMIATGKAAKDFNGLVRSNGTANFILEQLQKNTTEESIVSAMMEHYGIDRETAARDAHKVLAQLKSEGFLDD